MAKAATAAITVRLPLDLKHRLERRAQAERRSLSAQVVHDLEEVTSDAALRPTAERRSIVGMYEGTRVPTMAEFRQVRRALSASMKSRGKLLG